MSEQEALSIIDELLFNLGYTNDNNENYDEDIFNAIEVLNDLVNINT